MRGDRRVKTEKWSNGSLSEMSSPSLLISWLTKFSEDQPRVPAGSPGGGEFGSGSGIEATFHPSERMQRAIDSQVRTGKKEQDIAERSEKVLSEAIGVPRTGDNSAFDLRSDGHGVEVKTFITGKNEKVTMSKAALGRKIAEQRADGIKAHTVVVDRRAGGMEGKATYYYKEGVGSFRLGSMTKVTLSQLKEIVSR